MGWELLTLGAIVIVTLVGLAAWALTGRGKLSQKVDDLTDHRKEHDEFHKRGEEFDAADGMRGAIARSREHRRRLRKAARKRDV